MEDTISYDPVSISDEKTASDIQRRELENCGVEFDSEGNPLWYSVPEFFDELDRRLIDHYGEEYRTLANRRRARWNNHGDEHFDTL